MSKQPGAMHAFLSKRWLALLVAVGLAGCAVDVDPSQPGGRGRPEAVFQAGPCTRAVSPSSRIDATCTQAGCHPDDAAAAAVAPASSAPAAPACMFLLQADLQRGTDTDPTPCSNCHINGQG